MGKRCKKSAVGSRKSFSERAGCVADIILDCRCADRGKKAKNIKREVFLMLTDLKKRVFGDITGRDLLRDAARGAGKLSGLPKRAYHDVFNAFKA